MISEKDNEKMTLIQSTFRGYLLRKKLLEKLNKITIKQAISIISDIFFGIQETNNICLNCKNYFLRQEIKMI